MPKYGGGGRYLYLIALFFMGASILLKAPEVVPTPLFLALFLTFINSIASISYISVYRAEARIFRFSAIISSFSSLAALAIYSGYYDLAALFCLSGKFYDFLVIFGLILPIMTMPSYFFRFNRIRIFIYILVALATGSLIFRAFVLSL